MARPSKTAAIDYAAPHELTHGLLERAACPAELPFVLVRDADKKGLRLRVTKAGGKHWQFETRIKGKLFTRALGEWPAVSIDAAKVEAHRLRGLTEAGTDPRELERQQQTEQAAAIEAAAAKEAQQAQQKAAQALTVGEVWKDYLEKRRPFWGDLHYRDHLDKASPGGVPSKRRGASDKLTKPGPLAELMPLPLIDLDQAKIEAWAANEGKTRPSSARLAWRLLTVFLTWCAEQPEYSALLPHRNPAKTKKAREALGKANVKYDVLQKNQLSAWFTAVQKIQNPTISAFLQVLLLTGARLNEVQTMRWEDVNTQWKGLSINDKMEGTREVPLTPYVEKLITALPRRNAYVFASARVLDMSEKNIERRQAKAAKRGKPAPVGEVLETSETGYISEPNTPHTRACRTVGIEGLTLHGLRRSFASLCEWLDIPGGVSAQIQGHAPQGVREQNYIRRPLDLLRVHHEKIEAWILEQAGIKFDPKAKPGKLHAVAA
ncbi:integrase family protein [Rhodoferax sp.]|uniref:tyrosine-type recombinase/integrase n=1 Tax=Rhodoferax sp. TaxID=50421 RepID=UPI0025EF0173|nr:integrase family protein [Rhodoferax sp.]MCM2340855.1 integrase family protein [Rhodoferax sp.]